MTRDSAREHLDLATVLRLGAGELPRAEAFDVAWHLFLCPPCRHLLAEAGDDAVAAYTRLFGTGGMPFPPDAYAEPVGRVAESLRHVGLELQADRAGARQLVDRLLRHDPQHRRLLVRERERYRSFTVADLLIEAARATWSHDPDGAEDLAELALWILDRLDPRLFPRDMLNDLRAQAWGAIGNCRRIGSRLASVTGAFELAEKFLQHGTGDPTDRAALLDLRVAYLIDLHRFDEADAALQLLRAEHRKAGDAHAEGRVLLQLAKLRREQGRVADAVPLLERAQTLIDLAREPELELPLRRDLALYWAEAGRADEAQARLPALRTLARAQPSRAERLRVLRVEGVVYHHLGHLELAIEALDQARVGFVDLGLGYDAAFATLDLAMVYADADEPGRARALGAEMLPLFESRELHHEARAALSMLHQALTGEAVDRRLVTDVAAFLRRAQPAPELGSGLDDSGMGG